MEQLKQHYEKLILGLAMLGLVYVAYGIVMDDSEEKIEIAKQEDESDEDNFTSDEDTDGDGIGDYEEDLVGTDPEDPDDTPTQDEVAAALAEQEAKLAE